MDVYPILSQLTNTLGSLGGHQDLCLICFGHLDFLQCTNQCGRIRQRFDWLEDDDALGPFDVATLYKKVLHRNM